MKKQIFIIHGGETFNSYQQYWQYLKNYKIELEKNPQKKWKDTLGEKLGQEYEIIFPMMPSPRNAKYKEWKLWFEKHLPFVRKGVVLLGHSLGGIFLSKYLSEEKMKKKPAAALLVAAPFDDKDSDYVLGDFRLKKDLSLITRQCPNTIFYFSKDDECVPFVDAEKYQRALPNAKFRIYKNRGHFRLTSFPEIIRDIKALASKK